MTKKEFLRAKLYRLEELRKYQSYYGPNTPYPVIIEINELEAEIRRLKQPPAPRPAPVAKKKKKENSSIWHMSRPTFDAVATIAFIGLVFLLGSIIFAAYVQTRPKNTQAAANILPLVSPTLRPTFTPTADPDNPAQPPPQAAGSDAAAAGVVIIDNPDLPAPVQEATPVPTQVATLTPSPSPIPTEIPPPTETPVPPTNTPIPTSPPPAAPPPAAAAPQPALAEPAAAESPPIPAEPSFPFMIAEQGNREFQHTTYHGITIYVAVVSEGNIPLGGYKVIGDHVPSGRHIESAPSDWNWSVVNCLDCDYIKQGNLKFEPGTFEDGIWNIYLTDQSGAPLSPTVSLTYSANPDAWVWDFVIFRRKSG